MTISEFTSDIQHANGQENKTVAVLSRLEMNIIQQAAKGVEALRDNQKDQEFQNLLVSEHISLKLGHLPSPIKGMLTLGHMTRVMPRPSSTQNVRKLILSILHTTSHLGAKATTKPISARYLWPNLQIVV